MVTGWYIHIIEVVTWQQVMFVELLVSASLSFKLILPLCDLAHKTLNNEQARVPSDASTIQSQDSWIPWVFDVSGPC